jgi:hypothetical protein
MVMGEGGTVGRIESEGGRFFPLLEGRGVDVTSLSVDTVDCTERRFALFGMLNVGLNAVKGG